MHFHFNKVLLFAFSIAFIILLGSSAYSVSLFLVATISSCFIYVFGSENKQLPFNIIIIANLLFSLLIPDYTLFLPLLLLDTIFYQKYIIGCFYIIPVINYGIHCFSIKDILNNLPAYVSSDQAIFIFYIFLILLFLSSILLGIQSGKIKRDEAKMKQMQDTFTEHQLLLKNENESILQQQDYEIHIATLNERNRIAREIHDNVGHMISRSLLQIGALIAVNKDETKQPFYESLKDSLNEAMTNIRNSVHDLHDESINLKENLEKLLHEFTFCETKLDYDMSEHSDISIKYCFIAITKEALNNTMKHSKANLVHIHIIEHPAFYQYLFEDTTQYSKVKNTDDSSNHKTDTEEINNLNNIIINNSGTHHTGIGISNMRERVEKFNGTFISNKTDTGYSIHISIPKKK